MDIIGRVLYAIASACFGALLFMVIYLYTEGAIPGETWKYFVGISAGAGLLWGQQFYELIADIFNSLWHRRN